MTSVSNPTEQATQLLTSKQQLAFEAFYSAPIVELGFGGARGGGKSFMLGYLGGDLSIRYPGNMGVICRRDYNYLQRTTIPELQKAMRSAWPGVRCEMRGSPPRAEIHVGDAVSVIHFSDTKDAGRWMSGNLGFCLIDESRQVSEEFYLGIQGAVGRHRLANGDAAPQKLGWATNPGPGWCRRLFPVGKRARAWRDELPGGHELYRIYIPSLPRDNPHLPPTFEARLRARYPAVWVARFLEGDWDAFEGQVFAEFDDARHVMPYHEDLRGKPGWLHLLTGDWGYRNPAAFHLVSIDHDGAWRVWGEHRACEMTPAQHVPYLERLRAGLKIAAYLIDPAAVDQSTGITIAAQFHALGLPFYGFPKRKHSEDGSISWFKRLLQDEGRFRISPACPGAIQEIREARWQEISDAQLDSANPREQMMDVNDHSLDAIFGSFEFWRARGSRPLTPAEEDARAAMLERRERRRAIELGREPAGTLGRRDGEGNWKKPKADPYGLGGDFGKDMDQW
jgi:hypothetical protein